MREVKIKCLQRHEIIVEYDDNPNGLPVLWLSVNDNNRRITNVALDRESVSQLLVKLSNEIGEM